MSYRTRRGIPDSVKWDAIKRFHLSKPIEELRPEYTRRPTIVNASCSRICYLALCQHLFNLVSVLVLCLETDM